MYFTVSIVFPFKLGPQSHLAGPSFTLADVTVFPTVAFLFRYGWARGETMLGSDVMCAVCRCMWIVSSGSVGCLLIATRNLGSITLCWRTGQASKPAGHLTGWRTWRDKMIWRTSDSLWRGLNPTCFFGTDCLLQLQLLLNMTRCSFFQHRIKIASLIWSACSESA